VGQDLLNVLVVGSIYTLFALGLTLSWGVLNVLNLAHGAIFMFAGIVGYVVTKDSPLSLWVVLPVASLAAGLIALALEWVAYLPIRRRSADMHAGELSTMIASIAAASALVALAEVISKNQVVGVNPATFDVTATHVLGVRVTNLELIIIGLALLLSTALALFVSRSRHGRALRALAEDPYACGLMGVSSARMSSVTMFVSGALAGCAGLLLAMQQAGVDPRSGDPLLLKAFAVIILGGVGSVPGAILAAFILALAEVATQVYVSGSYVDGVAFALILLLLLFRPQGLFAQTAWKRA
jgi:branched-chain amino acid transport system permease protein